MLRVRYALFCMLTMRIKRAKSNDKNLFSLGRIRICDRRREIDEFLKLKTATRVMGGGPTRQFKKGEWHLLLTSSPWRVQHQLDRGIHWV